MSNEKTEAVPPQEAQKPGTVGESPFILEGEIHIVASKDGSIQVSGPENMVVALGLMETGKEVLLESFRQRQRMAAQARARQAIIPAGKDALKNLEKLKP